MSAKVVSQKAFVMGATGTTGKAIVKALVDNPAFTSVTLIGRRPLELPSNSENPGYSKIDQKIIDFEDPSSYADSFRGYDVGFFALGAGIGHGVSPEQYYRITHDYAVGPAKLAKEGGCRHFHFMSGAAASKTSFLSAARIKAEVEEELSQMGFERLSIYRPKMIIKDMNEVTTTAEKAGIWAYKIFDPFNLLSVDSLFLGKMIVDNTLFGSGAAFEILYNSDIFKLGKEFNKSQSPVTGDPNS